MTDPHVPIDDETFQRWEARYQTGDTPWETGKPDSNLITAIERQALTPGHALDVGCGYGNEARWLAGQGWRVTGVDLSGTAIAAARNLASEAGLDVEFLVGSFPSTSTRFDLAYDCGCFHIQSSAPDRAAFAKSVMTVLKPGGLWINIAGSTDGPPRDHGPPRISARDIVEAAEPYFEVLSLASGLYDANVPSPARAWVSVLRRRKA